MTTHARAEDPRQAAAQQWYEPQHEPFERWDSWKFGLHQESAVNQLWDKFNTIRIPILGFRQFMLDVQEISAHAENRKDLEIQLSERRCQRVRELQDTMLNASTSIVENPMRTRNILGSGLGLRTDGDKAIDDVLECIEHGSPDLASLAKFFGNLAHGAQTNALTMRKTNPETPSHTEEPSPQPVRRSPQPSSPHSPAISTPSATIPTPTPTETNVPSRAAQNLSPATTRSDTSAAIPTKHREEPTISSSIPSLSSGDGESGHSRKRQRSCEAEEEDLQEDPYPAYPCLFGPETWHSQHPGDGFSYYEMSNEFDPVPEKERPGHAIEIACESLPEKAHPTTDIRLPPSKRRRRNTNG